MERNVVIAPYRSDWSAQYEKASEEVKEVFGSAILGMEHIGSTSVYGLSAKPIIDFMVGVQDLSVVNPFIEPLRDIRFEHVFHPELPNRRFFRRGERGAGTHHLHIYTFGSDEWNQNLLFRNYLRANSGALKRYEQLKKQLANQYPQDRAAYTKAKHPFITEIIEMAKTSISF